MMLQKMENYESKWFYTSLTHFGFTIIWSEAKNAVVNTWCTFSLRAVICCCNSKRCNTSPSLHHFQIENSIGMLNFEKLTLNQQCFVVDILQCPWEPSAFIYTFQTNKDRGLFAILHAKMQRLTSAFAQCFCQSGRKKYFIFIIMIVFRSLIIKSWTIV